MGKYPPLMENVLAYTPEEIKTVVDLGCGSGGWYLCVLYFHYQLLIDPVHRILDVARDFAHCSCVAVDLIPLQIL